jgi:hypothetical protein
MTLWRSLRGIVRTKSTTFDSSSTSFSSHFSTQNLLYARLPRFNGGTHFFDIFRSAPMPKTMFTVCFLAALIAAYVAYVSVTGIDPSKD